LQSQSGWNDRGTIVAIHDATADYQGDECGVPVIQVMLVVLVIFSLAGMGYGRKSAVSTALADQNCTVHH